MTTGRTVRDRQALRAGAVAEWPGLVADWRSDVSHAARSSSAQAIDILRELAPGDPDPGTTLRRLVALRTPVTGAGVSLMRKLLELIAAPPEIYDCAGLSARRLGRDVGDEQAPSRIEEPDTPEFLADDLDNHISELAWLIVSAIVGTLTEWLAPLSKVAREAASEPEAARPWAQQPEPPHPPPRLSHVQTLIAAPRPGPMPGVALTAG